MSTQLYTHIMEFFKITHRNTYSKYSAIALSDYRAVYADIA